MTNLEIIELKEKIAAQKAAIKNRYAANIGSFSKAHGMDNGVCYDMLIFNAHCFMQGAKKDVIPGGGIINVSDLIKDVKVLDELKAKLK